MQDSELKLSIYQLSKFLYQYYGKKVIILLDEYDTPMQMEEKKYEQQLINCGVSHVRKYGFAIEGKEVLIG